METYTELCRVMGYVITEAIGDGDKPVYHIRKQDGKIVSRDYESPEEPIELMEYIRTRV